jgi:hypothetical protein
VVGFYTVDDYENWFRTELELVLPIALLVVVWNGLSGWSGDCESRGLQLAYLQDL